MFTHLNLTEDAFPSPLWVIAAAALILSACGETESQAASGEASAEAQGDRLQMQVAQTTTPKARPKTSSTAAEYPYTVQTDHPFITYGCYQCHGYYGHGASTGPQLSTAMPFEAFQQVVRKPYGVMPAYSTELLSDEDLRKMYAYLENVPAPAPLEDIPLLDAMASEE